MWEIYFLLSGGTETRVRMPAVSQVTLIQKTQYAEVAYSGVDCPETYHQQAKLAYIKDEKERGQSGMLFFSISAMCQSLGQLYQASLSVRTL